MENKHSWTIYKIRPLTYEDADKNALFEATLLCRELPSLSVAVNYWGSPGGLPDSIQQAEAFIRAVVMGAPRSLEEISQVAHATRLQKPKELSEALSLLKDVPK